ncbi:hypothetical protein D3C81_1711500 [compost metagenome]
MPRPRIDAPDAPRAKLVELPSSLIAPVSNEVSVSRIWRTVLAPVALISSRRNTVTGEAVSVSRRLMFEPVTSTRCMTGSAASPVLCAWAEAAMALKAKNTALLIGLNFGLLSIMFSNLNLYF